MRMSSAAPIVTGTMSDRGHGHHHGKSLVVDIGSSSSNSGHGHHCAMEDVLEKYEARIRALEAENAALKQETAALRREQVEIKTAKELYLKIFEDFPALIWRSRLDKLCDYFNRTWLEWTGKTMDDEFGHGWAKGVHPDDFDKCLEIYVAAFDKREAFYMEYRLLDRHGDYRWIGDHGRPFYDLDGTTFLGYIGSCYDINDAKLNEQKLVKLNATKDKFFSIVAHDLRNPIASFVSVSEMLMENYDAFEPEDMEEIAAQLHKDSQCTLALLENLLDWSKSQSDEIKFEPTLVNLELVCQEVVEQATMGAKAKNITIQHDTTATNKKNTSSSSSSSSTMSLSADTNMLKTVLRNLVCNAIKFSHAGAHVQITAAPLSEAQLGEIKTTNDPAATSAAATAAPAVEDDDEGDCCGGVLITVSDTGIGMSQQQIANLFGFPGSNGNGSNSSKRPQSTRGTGNEGGSGLGLVICNDFVESHGGRIWAESQIGKGTDFKFVIPCFCSSSSSS